MVSRPFHKAPYDYTSHSDHPCCICHNGRIPKEVLVPPFVARMELPDEVASVEVAVAQVEVGPMEEVVVVVSWPSVEQSG